MCSIIALPHEETMCTFCYITSQLKRGSIYAPRRRRSTAAAESCNAPLFHVTVNNQPLLISLTSDLNGCVAIRKLRLLHARVFPTPSIILPLPLLTLDKTSTSWKLRVVTPFMRALTYSTQFNAALTQIDTEINHITKLHYMLTLRSKV